MKDKLKQSLLSILIMLAIAITATTVQAVTYLDEQALYSESGLSNHNCGYCYGGKAKYKAQSGSYTTSTGYGWYATNDSFSWPTFYMYIPNFSGSSGTTPATAATNLGQIFRDINQDADKGTFKYLAGFSGTAYWGDAYWTNKCASSFPSCTNWKTVWWDQVRID